MKASLYVTCAFLLGIVAATMIPAGGSDSEMATMVVTGSEASAVVRSVDGQPPSLPVAPGLLSVDETDARPIPGVETVAAPTDPPADRTVVPASLAQPLDE